MDIKQTISRNKELTAIITFYLAAQLYLLTLVWDQPLTWDSSIYAAMGQYIYSLGEIGMWEIFRPILMPILLGPLYLLGIPMHGYSHLLMLIISTLGLIAIYKFIERDFSKDIAIYTVGITASSSLYLFNGNLIRTELVSAILIIGSIYLLNNQKQYLSGLIASLAFLMRFPSALIGLSNAIANTLPHLKNKEIKQILTKNTKLTLGFAILAGTFFIASHIRYGNFLQPIIAGIEVPAGNPETQLYGIYYLKELILSQPLLVLTPIGAAIALKKDKLNISPYLTALIILYAFQEYFPHKEPRYSLIFLPLAALYASQTLQKIQQKTVPKIEQLNTELFKKLLVFFFCTAIIYSTLQIAPTKDWSNPEENQFLQETNKLPNNAHLAGNHPNIAVYSEKKYTQLPEGFITHTVDNNPEINYIAINSCAWFSEEGEAREEINDFMEELENEHEKQFESGGETCTYSIYKYGE